MAIKREELNKKWAQHFRGGIKPLDKHVLLQLDPGTCCEDGGFSVQMDRLPSRMRFDNGLAHENPKGANQKFVFQYHSTRAREMVEHFSRVGEGARFSFGVLPTYSILYGIGVTIGNIPDGWEFKIGMRKAGAAEIEIESGLTIKITGDGCSPEREATPATAIPNLVPLEKGVLHLDTVLITKTLIFPDAAEFYIEVVQAPKDSEGGVVPLSANEVDFVIGLNYDLVVRAEI